MRVGITGASGFIGRHLIRRLCAAGHGCIAFARDPSRPVPGCVETRTAAPDRELDVSRLDAVVNLAGESIMGRWTAAKKRRVIGSRVGTTERLVKAIRQVGEDGPRALINASAIGFYGDRGDELVDETSEPGRGFLAEVCQRWEAAALEATGLRVACVRIGFVFGADGGAFPMLRRLFSLGLGGRLGSGQQWMSPVHVEDVAGLMTWLIEQPAATGAFNAACLQPVRNVDFTRELAGVLRRPAVLPAPGWVLQLGLGEMSHVALDSQRVLPTRTLAEGYRFKFPDLPAILSDVNGEGEG